MHEYIGNVHLHTTYSDGSASPEEVVRLAESAGLDFVIPTDHNVYISGLDGWYGRTLLLVGEEIHDRSREPQVNHYLAFDVYEDLAAFAHDPQRLIHEVRERGGFGFIAHPFERAAPRFGQEAIPWLDWQVEGYTGLSIWNYMSEFKSYLRSVPAALFASYFPRAVIRGPFPETLARWDELLSTRQVPVIGTSDAHAHNYKLGLLRGQIFPYAYLFQTVNLHILSEQPFGGDWRRDKDIVYGAMKRGRSFIGYEVLGKTKGFRFVASSAGQQAGMGQELPLQGTALLEVSSPHPADLRLVRQGRVVAWQRGTQLNYVAKEQGAYRVEAYRRSLLRWRGWVFTNPIYLV